MENDILQEEEEIISAMGCSSRLEAMEGAHRRVVLRRTDSSSVVTGGNRVQFQLKADE